MKDKIKPKIKGHLLLKVDNQIIYDSHNEVQTTALEIIAAGLAGDRLIGLGRIKIYNVANALVETIETPIITNSGTEIIYTFSKGAEANYQLKTLNLNEEVSDTIFSSVVLGSPISISNGQTVEIIWALSLTL
jgi:hypothetical protein